MVPFGCSDGTVLVAFCVDLYSGGYILVTMLMTVAIGAMGPTG